MLRLKRRNYSIDDNRVSDFCERLDRDTFGINLNPEFHVMNRSNEGTSFKLSTKK